MKVFNYKYSYVEVKENGKEVVRKDSYQRTEYEGVGRGENFIEIILNNYKWATRKNSLAVENYSKKYKCNQKDIEIKFNENKVRIEVYKNGELVEFIKFEEVED